MERLDELVYTLGDVQRALKISKPTALNLIHSEGFPKLDGVGERLLIPKKALEEWIEKSTIYSATERISRAYKKGTHTNDILD